MEISASQQIFPFSLALGSKSITSSDIEIRFMNLRKGNSYPEIYKELFSSGAPSTQSMALKLAVDLTFVVESNETKTHIKSIFDAVKIPKISIKDYFIRVSKFSLCSLESMVLCVIYLDRYFISSGVSLNSQNIHR